MKKTLITILLVSLFMNCYSQDLINLNRSESKKYLLKFWSKQKGKTVNTITTETDSTLTYLIRDLSVQNLDLVFHFDTSGKCDRELRTLTCDSCFQKHLKSVLAQKFYNWVKVDDKTYVSRYSKRLIVSIPAEPPFAFVIERHGMSRNEYKRRFKKV